MKSTACKVGAALVAVAWLAGCGLREESAGGLVASVPPVGMVLWEVAHGAQGVACLLEAGASPHTYAPRPSDAARAEGSLGVVYVSDELDGWAAELPASRRVALLPLLPEAFRLSAWVMEEGHEGHDHGEVDPHFWGDPLAVRAMLPGLAAVLREWDPGNAAAYRAGAARFGEALTALDGELAGMLAPVRGRSVLLFHPSWRYFLARYGIETAGVVEPFAGREATAKYLAGVSELARREGVRAVLTEPQLARRPAELVAETTGLPLYELDPLGGVPGRMTYAELLRYNAGVLLEALQ